MVTMRRNTHDVLKETFKGIRNMPTELDQWISYYQILIDDVKYTKNRQWQISYYTMILLAAAIIGLSTALNQKPIQIILFIISGLLAAVGTYILVRFQKDLRRYRENITKVRLRFPGGLKEIASYKPAEEDKSYYVNILYIQIGTIWVSVVFVGWVVGFWSILYDVFQNL